MAHSRAAAAIKRYPDLGKPLNRYRVTATDERGRVRVDSYQTAETAENAKRYVQAFYPHLFQNRMKWAVEEVYRVKI